MSTTNLYYFSLESIHLDSIPLLFLVIGFGFLEFSFHSLMYLVKRNKNHPTKTGSLPKSEFGSSRYSKQTCESPKTSLNGGIEDGSLCRGDVEMVMARLGLFCHPEGEKLQGRLGFDDLSKLFEESEPSFNEIKGAFDVFDQNRDGFIDEIELQKDDDQCV